MLRSVLLRAGGTPVSIGKRVIVGMFFCKGGDMKYLLRSKLNDVEVVLSPGDDPEENGGDMIFALYLYSETDDKPTCAYIPASEFYQFMDNIRTWAPDMRK